MFLQALEHQLYHSSIKKQVEYSVLSCANERRKIVANPSIQITNSLPEKKVQKKAYQIMIDS
jgi:hypothetical protein